MQIDVGGGKLEYRDRGDGEREPLLLVHAGAFAEWFPGLPGRPVLDGFRLVGPVRLGYDAAAPLPRGT